MFGGNYKFLFRKRHFGLCLMFRWGYWSLHSVFLLVMLDKMQLLQFYQKICQFQKSQQKALKIGMDFNIIEIMSFNWLWMWPSLQYGLNSIRFSRTWSLEPHINSAAYKMAVSHPNVVIWILAWVHSLLQTQPWTKPDLTDVLTA